MIEKIIACRTSYPLHAIRIHAEKHRPEVHFTYWVYRLPDETPAKTQKTTLPAITDVGKQDLPAAYTEVVPVPRNRFWRIVSIGGMLLASVMVFEVATV